MPRVKQSNLPPEQRDNWSSKDKGQQAYSQRQWAKSRYNPNRASSAAGSSSAKRRKTEDTPSEGAPAESPEMPAVPEPSTSATSHAEPMDTSSSSLPGTAADQGGGQPIATGPRSFALPRPTLPLFSSIRSFRKVHRFLTFGVAFDIIKAVSLKQPYVYMSTPLAAVPWHMPYFYLSPAEFASLPKGSTVVGVSVSVISRNVRVAFETNSSDSKLATLNQNKDIIVAEGLNINCKSINGVYSGFNDKEPMIPTSFNIEDDSSHQAFHKDLYGGTDQLHQEVVPRHQAGIPLPIPWYCIIPKPQYPANNPSDPGWPLLQHYYEDWDADALSNKQFAQYTYSPKMGFLTAPLEAIYTGITPAGITTGDIVKIRHGNQECNQRELNITLKTGERGHPQEIVDNTVPAKSIVPAEKSLFSYTTPIEKSEYMFAGNFGNGTGKVQPTLHIGVKPVVALTTANQAASNSHFTDTQAYFEVVAEMQVELNHSTPYPLYVQPHCTENGMVWAIGSMPNEMTLSMYNGLHQFKQT